MRWISFAVLAAVASSGAWLLSGCDEAGVVCNAIGARCELAIGLAHAAWEPGDYVFEATENGETHRCAVALPASTRGSWDCSYPGWGLSQFDWEAEPPYPPRLALAYASGEVTVRILYGDKEIACETFRPHYQETEPHGEGCGICRNAEVTMEF